MGITGFWVYRFGGFRFLGFGVFGCAVFYGLRGLRFQGLGAQGLGFGLRTAKGVQRRVCNDVPDEFRGALISLNPKP